MSDKTLKTTIQFRRDTTENWVTNKGVVPAAGEPCFDKDTGVLKIGDGVATYENLPRVGGVSAAHYEGVRAMARAIPLLSSVCWPLLALRRKWMTFLLSRR